MARIFNFLFVAISGSIVLTPTLVAQIDTSLSDLLDGRIRFESRDQRMAVARSLLTAYSNLDTAIPFTQVLKPPNDRPSAVSDANAFDIEIGKRNENANLSTDEQIDVARRAINGITNFLRFILDSSTHSLKFEMFHWAGLCFNLLDDEAFENIARLHAKGVISVPREFRYSQTLPPGWWPKRHARAIIERYLQTFLLSKYVPK